MADEVKRLRPADLLRAVKDNVRYCYRIVRHTFRLFLDNRGPYQANALAYRSMLSMVPMLAFVVSVLSWIYGMEDVSKYVEYLQKMLQDYLVPDSDIVTKSFNLISGFLQQARQGTLVGFLILFLTSVFLINGIETIFNNIWHIVRRRAYALRALSYTALIILLPLLLGVSIFMTARLQVDAVVDTFAQTTGMEHVPLFHWAVGMIRGTGLPLTTVWLLFLAMYRWLPNTKVEMGSAMVAALFAAVLFEICKLGFSLFAAQMVVRRELWWGSLGVFLVFLMWVYIIWWIVLFGAQLTYVIQNYRFVLKKNPDPEQRMGEAYLATRVMLEISRDHVRGDRLPTVRQLAGQLEVEVPRVQKVLARLTDANLVLLGTTSEKRGAYEEVYVPGRDLGTISLAEVVRTATDFWEMPGPGPEPATATAADDAVAPLEETAVDLLNRVVLESRGLLESSLRVSFRELLAKDLEKRLEG